MKDQQYDQIVKFLIVGDSKVGKTCIVKNFCNGQYNSHEQSTNTLQYGQKIITLSGKKVLFQIWDTPSNQNFKLILPALYSSVMGILLVFSVDNRNSFNSIAVWIKQIETFTPEHIPTILLANKADLRYKQVSQRQAQALSEAISLDMVMVSAARLINIEQTMIKLYQKRKKQIQYKIQKKIQKVQKKQPFSIFKCNF